SAGLDTRWRQRAVHEIPAGSARVLDVCTGTADLAVATSRQLSGTVVGVDFSGAMLRLGLSKVRSLGLDRRIRLLRGDATKIPLADATCDAATIAFRIRNVEQPERAIAEIARVLRPGGRLVILEFGQPRILGMRTLYTWYFRYLLPLVGRLVSHHRSAYSYLPASVGAFPSPADFSSLIRTHGFATVRA